MRKKYRMPTVEEVGAYLLHRGWSSAPKVRKYGKGESEEDRDYSTEWSHPNGRTKFSVSAEALGFQHAHSMLIMMSGATRLDIIEMAVEICDYHFAQEAQ